MRFWSLDTRFSVSRQVSGFHPYIGFLTALIASALLVTPLSSRSSCLRQPILWLSHRPLLLPGKGMALLPSPSPKNRACHFHGTRLKHFKRPLRRTQYSNRSFVALLLRLYDSPLQTTHVAIGQLPFDGAPVNGLTQARASSARRRGFKFPTNSCLLRHRQRVSY